jgi:hypothetical protein
MRATIRGLKLRKRTEVTLDDIARELNPMVRGWIAYYGQYTRSALYPGKLAAIAELPMYKEPAVLTRDLLQEETRASAAWWLERKPAAAPGVASLCGAKTDALRAVFQ